MTAPTPLDRIHHLILEGFVARGRAPHLAERAAGRGLPPPEARALLRELAASGLPIWLQPGTDLIASCAPFNEVPTPYRATIDGRAGSPSAASRPSR